MALRSICKEAGALLADALVSVPEATAAAALSPQQERVLLVRLPCNPIFPIGPVYLADHLHKCFPGMPQRILDLAALPVLDVQRGSSGHRGSVSTHLVGVFLAGYSDLCPG
jgi:hypothetical protein